MSVSPHHNTPQVLYTHTVLLFIHTTVTQLNIHPLAELVTFAEGALKVGGIKRESWSNRGGGAGGVHPLIRILSSVFPTERWLDMSGFINRSRKYY